MTDFGGCRSCEPSGECNLDAAVVEVLRTCRTLQDVTQLHSAGAVGQSRQTAAIGYPRILVEVGSPGTAQYSNETTWNYDAPVNFTIYTQSPGEGIRLAGAIMEAIIQAERIEFAFGSACVYRPALPRQRDLGRMAIETTFTLQATVHHKLGNWCGES